MNIKYINRQGFTPIILLVIVFILLISSFFYLRQLNPWFLFDYIQYWSAGSLLLTHQNPYDPAAMLAVQQTLGWSDTTPLMMWIPPWAAPLGIPLALFDYATSRTLWFFFQVAVLVYSAVNLWKLYAGQQRSGKLVSIFSGILTGSVFWMLFLGQVSFLILLGMVGFLILIRRQTFKSDFLAGMMAAFIAIKPQVIYLFWPALLIWTFTSRRWGIVLGSLFALFVGVLFGSIFYPDLIRGYWVAIRTNPPTAWYTPTIGYWLRHWLGFEQFWLQFLPIIPALIWVFLYTWHKHLCWEWKQELPLLILVSLATSAYTWTHDQVVFLLPFIYMATVFFQANHRKTIYILGGLWLAINTFLFGAHFFFQEHYFAWLAPLMLIFYLVAKRVASRITSQLLPEEVG